MSSFSGHVNFDNGSTLPQFNFSPDKKSLMVQSSLLSLTLNLFDNEHLEEHYFYDKEKNILIISKGILFLNNQKNPLNQIVKLYTEMHYDFLKKIPGSFLLAVINFSRPEVVLATDSIGMLRLYYSFQKSKLIFSTEIRELFNSSSELSKEGLMQYLMINYYTDDKTIFYDINRVLPGRLDIFQQNKKSNYKYFELFDYLVKECASVNKISLEEVSGVLRSIIPHYTDKLKATLTLTSGYDSRLLLAACLSQNIDITAFTFGVKENLEFKIAEKISKKINKINYFQVELDEEYENCLTSYFDYIKQSKNIELNFNRYHYLYIWNKLKTNNNGSNILTGICGDSFTRDGLSVSYQTNKLLMNLIFTVDKVLTIKNYVISKKDLLNNLNLSEEDCIDYLMNLFSFIQNGDKYNNHFHIKINFGMRNYFATEINLENEMLSTYPIFQDIRYLQAMIGSGYSIMSNKFLDAQNSYKLKSHKFYYKLIHLLYDELNHYPTNRGFPLKYSSSNIYLPLRLFLNMQMKRKKHMTDLNYVKWRQMIELDKNENFTFDESIKLKTLSLIN